MKKLPWALVFIVVIVFAVLFAGCAANLKVPDSESQKKGRSVITNGAVNFYELKPDGTKGSLYGSSSTDSNGYFHLPASEIYTSTLIEVSGGSYYDAFTGTSVPLASTEKLTAVASPYKEVYAVTPLTHMAAARAHVLAARGTPIGDAITAANTNVGLQYNIVTEDPYYVHQEFIHTIPANTNDPDDVKASSRTSRVYGVVNAAIAGEANSLDISPVSFTSALADDMSDGVLDGNKGITPITLTTKSGKTLPLTASNSMYDVQTKITEYLKSPDHTIGFNQIQIPLQNLGADMYTGNFGAMYPILPTGMEGNSYFALLGAKGGTPPYKWSLKPGSSLPNGFSLTQDGKITSDVIPLLPSGSLGRISSPFTIGVKDSANPPATSEMTLYITILKKPPEITPIHASCPTEKEYCEVLVATATGLTPPYYYYSGSFLAGTPPLGMTIWSGPSGAMLRGKPAKEGSYRFKVCVVDVVGIERCGFATVDVGGPAETTGTSTGGVAATTACQKSTSPGSASCGYCAGKCVSCSGECAIAVGTDAGTFCGMHCCPKGYPYYYTGKGCFQQPQNSQQSAGVSSSTVPKDIIGTWKTPSPVTFYFTWNGEMSSSSDQDITWKIYTPNDPSGIIPDNVVFIETRGSSSNCKTFFTATDYYEEPCVQSPNFGGVDGYGTINGTRLTIYVVTTPVWDPSNPIAGEFTFTSDMITGTYDSPMSCVSKAGCNMFTKTNALKLIKGNYPFV